MPSHTVKFEIRGCEEAVAKKKKKKKKMVDKSVTQMADDSELWFFSRLKKRERKGERVSLTWGEKSQRGHGRTEEAREEERCC